MRSRSVDQTTQSHQLRRDAELNRQRILKAAAEVFTERGLGVTLDQVAEQAGVGVGTVYRRFPNKEALADALFVDKLDQVRRAAEAELDNPDAWDALAGFLEQAVTLIAADRGLRQILMFATYSTDQIQQARARLQPFVIQLVERAQREGVVRADLHPSDMALIEFMLTVPAEYAWHVRPSVWRRYLTLILDGLRPARAAATPLPEPALSRAELQRVHDPDARTLGTAGGP